MVLIRKFFTVAVAAIWADSVMAHGRARETSNPVKRDLNHCAAKLEARGHTKRMQTRRAEQAQIHREKRGLAAKQPFLKARDLTSVTNTSHHSSADYTLLTPESTVFTSNQSCFLLADYTEGPFYVQGEMIRTDIREDQPGIDLVIDMEIVDASNCEPISNAYIELFHANSTGVYSGVNASDNGLYPSNQASILNMTFLRGMAPTDADGYVQMITKFPGFYNGPTVHIHVIAHVNGTVLPNGTYAGGSIMNVGYIYFDQSLITEVMDTYPYNTNNLSFVTNVNDYVFVDEANVSDPVLEYVYLGENVTDGLFGWKTFGMDPTHNVNVSVASFYQKDGGHSNPDDNYWALHTPPPNSTAVGSA